MKKNGAKPGNISKSSSREKMLGSLKDWTKKRANQGLVFLHYED